MITSEGKERPIARSSVPTGETSCHRLAPVSSWQEIITAKDHRPAPSGRGADRNREPDASPVSTGLTMVRWITVQAQA